MSASQSRETHPNHAPGVPMLMPVWLERMQIKYFNPLVRPFSKFMPGFAVIKHRGRTSGKAVHFGIIRPRAPAFGGTARLVLRRATTRRAATGLATPLDASRSAGRELETAAGA